MKAKPKLSTPIFARVDNATLRKLEKLAHPESMSVLLRKIIREYLAKQKC